MRNQSSRRTGSPPRRASRPATQAARLARASTWPVPHSPSARDSLYKARLDQIAAEAEARHARSLEVLKAELALEKASVEHELAESAALAEADREAAAAEDSADRASSASYVAAVMEVAKGSHERTRSSAEFVQKAATAIFGLYTGALTLSFSVTAAPLPVRGILPSVFLGLSVVLASAYLAYLTRGGAVPDPEHARGREQAELERARTYVTWTRDSTMVRVWMLRASVIALAVGTIVLPLPFLTLSSPGAGVDAPQNTATCAAPLVADIASDACVPPWPDPPPEIAGPVELRELLYQAQVSEAATEREAARDSAVEPAADDTWVLWWVGGVGLGLVLLVPALTAGGSRIVRRVQSRATQRPPRAG